MKLYEGEYCIRMVDLPGDVPGAVTLTKDGSDFPNVYINDYLSPPARKKWFDHEMKHIEDDDFHNDKDIYDIEGY